MQVRVLAPFQDLKAVVYRRAGQVFEATPARFAEIDKKLPGRVEKVEEVKKTAPKKTRK